MYEVSIPKISDQELLRRYENIKPIMEYNGRKYNLREFSLEELKRLAYIYEPEINITDAADMPLYIARPDLEFECIHKFRYYGIFKPSIAEVLAQIPPDVVDTVDVFEIIRMPMNHADLTRNKILLEQGFHVSTVRLYTARNNPNINIY